MTSEASSAAARLIRQLDLGPHPEGGFYRETYRSGERVARAEAGVERCASTAIYYLLCDGAYSAWHRIRSDELWHFHAGAPLHVHVLDQRGGLTTHRLGNALESADVLFQAVVPAGCWFAAECAEQGGFALVGCTVAPGFEFSDFELADAAALGARCPEHTDLIERLARR
jgi:predicted cupin superfamily sugar epimerase